MQRQNYLVPLNSTSLPLLIRHIVYKQVKDRNLVEHPKRAIERVQLTKNLSNALRALWAWPRGRNKMKFKNCPPGICRHLNHIELPPSTGIREHATRARPTAAVLLNFSPNGLPHTSIGNTLPLTHRRSSIYNLLWCLFSIDSEPTF